MKAKELRDLTAEELQQRLDESQKELFNLRIQQATGQIEKASRVSDLRRDVARILTIQNERSKAK